MNILGEQIELLVKKGQQEVVLVAPYIKSATLQRILHSIQSGVIVHCITRWRPEEIAAGVSDLDVWDILVNRPRSTLWLHPTLHAKYYRADGNCLIGSANLTATALGWRKNANLELLMPIPADNPQLEEFEAQVFRESREVDQSIVESMQQLVNVLQTIPHLIKSDEDYINLDIEPIELLNPSLWLPNLRTPQYLYLCYCQQDMELYAVDQDAGRHDVLYLGLPLGLPEAIFEKYVGFLLLQQPLIQQIDQYLSTPQRFGAMRHFMKTLPCAILDNFDETKVWQTVMDWLFYFLPERYERVPSGHSEVVVKSLK